MALLKLVSFNVELMIEDQYIPNTTQNKFQGWGDAENDITFYGQTNKDE